MPDTTVLHVLERLTSHSILGSEEMKRRLRDSAGFDAPDWPEYSAEEVRQRDDFFDGDLGPVGGEKLCLGSEVAEACALKIVPAFRASRKGRGSRFRAALDAIASYEGDGDGVFALAPDLRRQFIEGEAAFREWVEGNGYDGFAAAFARLAAESRSRDGWVNFRAGLAAYGLLMAVQNARAMPSTCAP